MSTTKVINTTSRPIRLPPREDFPSVRVYPGANEVDEGYLRRICDKESEDYSPFMDELAELKMIRVAEEDDKPWTADTRVQDLPARLSREKDLEKLKQAWLGETREGAKRAIEQRMTELSSKDDKG